MASPIRPAYIVIILNTAGRAEGRSAMRSNAVAYERTAGGRATTSVLMTALAAVRRAGKFFQALGTELARIPGYQDEAERIREGLRRRHANSRGRDRPDLPDA